MNHHDRSEMMRDLVDPVKSFVNEVREDTVGDAKKFYAGQAKRIRHHMESSRKRTQVRKAELRREQEEKRKHRKAALKKVMSIIAVIAVIAFLVISAALNRGM